MQKNAQGKCELANCSNHYRNELALARCEGSKKSGFGFDLAGLKALLALAALQKADEVAAIINHSQRVCAGALHERFGLRQRG